MAGMLPGVECARRRRFHQSGIGGISDSLTTSTGYGVSRRSSFCLYTSNHEPSHLGSLSSSKQRSAQSHAYCDEKLGDAAREAKERLDGRLKAQWKSSSESKRVVVSGRQRSRNYLQNASTSPPPPTTTTTITTMESRRELHTIEEVFGMRKSRSKKFNWGKLRWKSTEQDEECAVCLEQYKVGENLIHLPCAHRFHSRCLIPWLDKNQHCPCCRMVF